MEIGTTKMTFAKKKETTPQLRSDNSYDIKILFVGKIKWGWRLVNGSFMIILRRAYLVFICLKN